MTSLYYRFCWFIYTLRHPKIGCNYALKCKQEAKEYKASCVKGDMNWLPYGIPPCFKRLK